MPVSFSLKEDYETKQVRVGREANLILERELSVALSGWVNKHVSSRSPAGEGAGFVDLYLDGARLTRLQLRRRSLPTVRFLVIG